MRLALLLLSVLLVGNVAHAEGEGETPKAEKPKSGERTYGVEHVARPWYGILSAESITIGGLYAFGGNSYDTFDSEHVRLVPYIYQHRLAQKLMKDPNVLIQPVPRNTPWAEKYGRYDRLKSDGTFGLRLTDFRVTTPDQSFGFRLETDPSVVEMPTMPFTHDELLKNRPWVESVLFEQPKKIGLYPARISAGDHIHTGTNAFGGNPLYFMNYVVDYMNHMELSMGAFGFNPVEATPPLLKGHQRAAFQEILNDFDAGKLKTVEAIQDRLAQMGMERVPGGSQKPAFNARTPYGTVENRAMRSFRTPEQMYRWFELNEARLDYLQGKNERVPFLATGPIKSVEQGVDQFHQYVRELGLDYERYKALLPDAWQRIRPTGNRGFQQNSEEKIPFRMTCKLLYHNL